MTTNPAVSPVQGEAVEPVADTEAVETVYAEPSPTSQHDHDGTCGRDCDAGWICTRTRGHDGNHEAGLGGGERGVILAASWPNEARPVAVPTAREGETRTVEYSIVRDYDGYRYGGYNEDCRAAGCDCYLARLPEPIIGDEHIEQREVYRTPWRRVEASS